MNRIKRLIKWFFSNRISKHFFILHEKRRIIRYERMGFFRASYLESVLAECGKGLIINGKPLIFHPEKIHMGSNVTINHGVQICPRADIFIGDNVTISRGAQLTAGSLDTSDWVQGNYIRRDHTQAEIHLAEGTWLCVNSIVLPGVNISGRGVIVAAGAVVTSDITEDFVVVGGVPAKIIKHLK